MRKYYLYTSILSIIFFILTYKYVPLFDLARTLLVLILVTLIVFLTFALSRRCSKCRRLGAVKKAGIQELSRYHISTYYREQDRSYNKKYKVTRRKFKRCKYCDYSFYTDKTTTEDGGVGTFSISTKMIVYLIVVIIWFCGFVVLNDNYKIIKIEKAKIEKKSNLSKIKKSDRNLPKVCIQ